MRHWSFFIYGLFCHLLFLLTFAYMAGFVGNLLLPKSIDTMSAVSTHGAVLIDVALIAMFGLQHSIMARPGFKTVWTRVVPQSIERSTYVLASCLVSFLLMWQWRAIDAVIWDVQNPVGHSLLWGLFATGWLLVPGVSLMINHFDLFGTRQVWLFLCGRPYTPLPFRTPLLYSRMRHPLYVGWALAFWATPTMTLGHLLFAGAFTLYMAIAARIEERDLVGYYGNTYRSYQRRVPMFIPKFGGGRESPDDANARIAEAGMAAITSPNTARGR
jgi:protein-S-isoprenylcysteine O-methyltransferase Ste14